MAAVKPEGYDYEFYPPADSKYMCPVCLMVLREPVQTDCGHRFCRACIQRWIRERGSVKCPVCNIRVTERSLFNDNCVKREIGSLTVRCPNAAKGCLDIIELSNIESHGQLCEFTFVHCANNCGTFVYRADLKHHMAYECCRRTVKCKFCHNDILYDQEEAHQSVCPDMRIKCQLCEEDIPRQKVSEHLKKRCPKAMVTCSFEQFGCKVEMPREKMEQHMAENSQQHLLMLSKAVNFLFKTIGVPLQFHDHSGTTDTLPLLNLTDSLTPEVGITLGTRPGDSAINDDVRLALQDLKLPSTATTQIMSGLSSICQSDTFLRTLNQQGVLSGGALSTAAQHQGTSPCCFEAVQSGPSTVASMQQSLPQFGSGLPSTSSKVSDHDELGQKHVVQAQYNALMESRVEKLERIIEEQGARLKYYKQCIESRFCNGTYVWKIKDFFRLRNEATQGRTTALHSTGFYCSVYGHKICIRINLNGVESGFATHVSLFIHFMKGEYDDILEWPFRGRITLSILDQNDDFEKRVDIIETLDANPELAAFQRPTTSRNHKGFGYIEFASISQIESSTYIKNDTLFVRASILSK